MTSLAMIVLGLLWKTEGSIPAPLRDLFKKRKEETETRAQEVIELITTKISTNGITTERMRKIMIKSIGTALTIMSGMKPEGGEKNR